MPRIGTETCHTFLQGHARNGTGPWWICLLQSNAQVACLVSIVHGTAHHSHIVHQLLRSSMLMADQNLVRSTLRWCITESSFGHRQWQRRAF